MCLQQLKSGPFPKTGGLSPLSILAFFAIYVNIVLHLISKCMIFVLFRVSY
jgi:hypothetical protein